MARMTEYGIIVHWKPIVWFVKGTRGDKHTFVDDLVSTQVEKDTHEWQQPLAEADYYIRQLSSPAGLVVDFFCGSGTTALAADRLGRKWRTYEIDPLTRDAAVRRIQIDRSSRRSHAA
jgi:DNA modification methylase